MRQKFLYSLVNTTNGNYSYLVYEVETDQLIEKLVEIYGVSASKIKNKWRKLKGLEISDGSCYVDIFINLKEVQETILPLPNLDKFHN